MSELGQGPELRTSHVKKIDTTNTEENVHQILSHFSSLKSGLTFTKPGLATSTHLTTVKWKQKRTNKEFKMKTTKTKV